MSLRLGAALARLGDGCALLTLALVPIWLRVPIDLWPRSWYALRHGIVLTMIGAVAFWALARFPNLADLRRDRLRLAFVVVMALLALWIAASTQWAFINFREPEVALSGAAQWLVTAAFVILIASGRVRPRAMVGVWGAVMIVIAAIVIAQTIQQGSIGLQALGELRYTASRGSPSILRAGELTLVRPYGLMPHPNITAGALVVGALALTAWLFSGARTLSRAAIPALALVIAALLLTFSRGAWAGLAAGGLAALPWLWPLLRRHWRRTLFAIGGLLLVAGLFVSLYAPFISARAGIGEESVELRSVADRIVYTEMAVRAFFENPIGGVGIGNFPWRSSYYLAKTFYDLQGDNVHNVLLSAAAELGIVGLALVIAGQTLGVIAAVRGLRAARDDERAARAALFAIWGALTVIGMVDHYPWTFPHFQLAWWGSLAALAVPPRADPPSM